MNLKIGLTGGIGAGKSLAAAEFGRLGVPIIDTDVLARTVVAAGQPALQEVAAEFGSNAIHASGGLNRAYLRELIFNNPQAKEALEGIIHPRVRDALTDQLAERAYPYHLLVSPLLFEKAQNALVDYAVVVDVPEPVQLMRAATRDGAEESAIRRIMASQWPRDTRMAQADFIIDNSGSPQATLDQVQNLHAQFVSMAID